MNLPPLNFSSNPSSSLNTSGSMFGVSGDGDWNVNIGGASVQSGASLLVLAAVGVGLWLLFRR